MLLAVLLWLEFDEHEKKAEGGSSEAQDTRRAVQEQDLLPGSSSNQEYSTTEDGIWCLWFADVAEFPRKRSSSSVGRRSRNRRSSAAAV